jgi:hypothetical protein
MRQDPYNEVHLGFIGLLLVFRVRSGNVFSLRLQLRHP